MQEVLALMILLTRLEKLFQIFSIKKVKGICFIRFNEVGEFGGFLVFVEDIYLGFGRERESKVFTKGEFCKLVGFIHAIILCQFDNRYIIPYDQQRTNGE